MDTRSESNDRSRYRGKTAYLTTIFTRWRKLHLITIVLEIIASFAACFNLAVFYQKFHPNCPLYAYLKIGKVDEGSKDLRYTVIMNQNGDGTVWGSNGICNFALYTPVISMLVAVAWILLFTIRVGYSPNSQRKMIPATCIFGFAITALTFGGAFVITRGGSILCESFIDSELNSCLTAQYVTWINFSRMYGFYDYLRRSQIAFWLATHIWFYLSFMCLIRWVTNADYVIADEKERDLFADSPQSPTRQPPNERQRNPAEDDTHED